MIRSTVNRREEFPQSFKKNQINFCFFKVPPNKDSSDTPRGIVCNMDKTDFGAAFNETNILFPGGGGREEEE